MNVTDWILTGLTDILWPVVYTIVGVFIGAQLSALVESERQREAQVLKPILSEVTEVSSLDALSTLTPIRTASGGFGSAIESIDYVELLGLNPLMYDGVMEYLDALSRYESYHVPHRPIADILFKADYDQFLLTHLDDSLVLTDSTGVDPTERPKFPGPAMNVGSYTTSSGESSYFDEGHRVPVRGARRYSLFAFLLENFELIQKSKSASGLREICNQHPEINVQHLDEISETWAADLWDALTTQWRSDLKHTDILSGDMGDQAVVEGQNFTELVNDAELILKLQRHEARGEVIKTATELRDRLLFRLGLAIYDPRRLALGALTATANQRLPEGVVDDTLNPSR